MTNAQGGLSRSTPNATGVFNPPDVGIGADLFNLSRPAQNQPVLTPLGQAQFTSVRVSRDSPYYYCRLVLYEARGGLNRQRGSILQGHNMLAQSTMDGRFPNTLTTFLKTTFQTGAGVTPDHTGAIYQANAFDTTIIGCGATANKALFKPTSSTNPDLAAITYSPGSAICSLSPVIISGNVDPRVVIGRIGAVGQIMTDASTISGTTLSDSDIYGIIQIAGTNYPMLLLVNTKIRTLTSANAIGDASTEVTPYVPSGGCALGPKALRNSGYIRAYWWFPLKHTVGCFMGSAAGKVISSNVYGYDLQDVKFNLDYVSYACIWRDGLVATDGRRIEFFNGQVREPINPFSDRARTSGVEYNIKELRANSDELRILVEIVDSNGSGNTYQYWEAYDPYTKTFHQVSILSTGTAGGSLHINFIPGIGFGPDSSYSAFRYAYTYQNATGWVYQYVNHYGESVLGLRKTLTGETGSGQAFESLGSGLWPAMQVPGMEGWPYGVARISGNPDVASFGTGGSVTWSMGGKSTTFTAAEPQGRHIETFQVDNPVYELQPFVICAQTSTDTDPTHYAGNVLPVTFEFWAKQPDALPVPTLLRDVNR